MSELLFFIIGVTLGGGDPYKMYQDYIDGKKEISEINAEYRAKYLHG